MFCIVRRKNRPKKKRNCKAHLSCTWYINQVDPGGCQIFLEQSLGSLYAHTVHRATSTRATDNSCSECAWRWLRCPFQLSRACLALLYGTKARATSPPCISTVGSLVYYLGFYVFVITSGRSMEPSCAFSGLKASVRI